MADIRIERDPGGLRVDLPLRPRWGVRALVASLIALGTAGMLIAAVMAASFNTIERVHSWSVPPVCSWERVQTHAFCRNDITMRPLQLESIALGRRAHHLKQLEPDLSIRSLGQLFRPQRKGEVEAFWTSLEESERQSIWRLVALRGSYVRRGFDFDAERLGEDGYLGSLVEDAVIVGPDGSRKVIHPRHPTALEADRLTLADIEQARPVVRGLAEAARAEALADREPGAEIPPSLPWTWVGVSLVIGACSFAAGLFGLFLGLRRRRHRVRLDAIGITLRDSPIRWEEIEDTDLSRPQPSVRLRDGSRIHAPAVWMTPEIGTELQQEARRWLARRREDPEAAAEPRTPGLTAASIAAPVVWVHRARRKVQAAAASVAKPSAMAVAPATRATRREDWGKTGQGGRTRASRNTAAPTMIAPRAPAAAKSTAIIAPCISLPPPP